MRAAWAGKLGSSRWAKESRALGLRLTMRLPPTRPGGPLRRNRRERWWTEERIRQFPNRFELRTGGIAGSAAANVIGHGFSGWCGDLPSLLARNPGDRIPQAGSTLRARQWSLGRIASLPGRTPV